ncbi:RraA family protein [Herbiconiux sp. KACC 21604]|uniref:RraA family protein n=1 Tax=unclassified Herbiconiux TaxID=2618217 RepID=UPI001490DEAD|nr:RraA family protein [Herbiconiux sp. SALV-R1]QJU55172.1 RraA family protein [Herbiconiux sp. SALV-R1]WPO86329.1 RraA family protein [Herbiconiux sp. KACC 21604]
MNNPYDYALPVQELIDRYRQLYSGAVYDVLEGLGFPHQALAVDVKPVVPSWVLAGPAFTIKGIPDPTGDEKLRARRIELFAAMKETGVPLVDVRDCSFDEQAAHYGEMNATVGASCGVIGAVVDGGSRDTRFLIERDFPIFCRYLTPVEALRRWSYYDWQTTVALRGALTATVTVSPGDFVFGDIDGVVIVPRDVVVEVLERTEALITEENETRGEFESGADPVQVYRKHGRL